MTRLLCNSYTFVCPPVREDNPRALASGLSYVQVDKHGTCIIIYTTNIGVDLAHHELFHAKVGKGVINKDRHTFLDPHVMQISDATSISTD